MRVVYLCAPVCETLQNGQVLNLPAGTPGVVLRCGAFGLVTVRFIPAVNPLSPIPAPDCPLEPGDRVLAVTTTVHPNQLRAVNAAPVSTIRKRVGRSLARRKTPTP